jgi:hypothetical protein
MQNAQNVEFVQIRPALTDSWIHQGFADPSPLEMAYDVITQELLLPLDYKDLVFAEETVDRKVKVWSTGCYRYCMCRLLPKFQRKKG